jgi:hypothetical protein
VVLGRTSLNKSTSELWVYQQGSMVGARDGAGRHAGSETQKKESLLIQE